MDAQVTQSFATYRLVNRDTKAVEVEGLGYQSARTAQNHLWARGIKTELVLETPARRWEDRNRDWDNR